MGLFGVVTDYLVGKYRGGSKDVGISTIKSGANDETLMNCFSPGIEINPADGEFIVFTQIKNSKSFLVSIGGINQNIALDTERGERRIYSVSSDGKTIKAKIKWKNDGVLELNGATDSAVLFSKLQTEFNKLNSKYDDLVTKYNGHIHPTPSGPSSVTTSLGSPSDANISNVESADVKLS